MKYTDLINDAMPSVRTTNPQNEPLPGMIPNNAGGFVYAPDDWENLDRFLILGSCSGSYYVGAHKLTKENAAIVNKLLDVNGPRVVSRIVEIVKENRAPKIDPALFAMALAASCKDPLTRKYALEHIKLICFTGTHILSFVSMVTQLRGWGRGLKRGVGDWFLAMEPERLAYQAIKYSQREGWALRDLLRLSHPKITLPESSAAVLVDWIVHPDKPEAITKARERFKLIDGKYKVNEIKSTESIYSIIKEYKLPREAIPTELLNDPNIWNALLVDMPLTAMIRNLGKMTAIDLIKPLSDAAMFVSEKLRNKELLKYSKVHPMQILIALKTYAQGHGEKGKLKWNPVPMIVEALNDAFYLSIENEVSTDKRILVGVDVSGSMQTGQCAGSSILSCVEAVMAMAMLFIRTEKACHVVGFDTEIKNLGITKNQRLDDILKSVKTLGGGTDLAQPIIYALKNHLMVDTFVILTDNETWAGQQHPVQALFEYRKRYNPQAKLVVLATTANGGTIVEPGDKLSLGIAGFDAAIPGLIKQFIL